MTKPAGMFDDPEIGAMALVASALDPLPEPVRLRVLGWARARYASQAETTIHVGKTDVGGREAVVYSPSRLEEHDTLGGLLDAAQVDTDDQRALAAAYLVGKRKGDLSFTAAEVNGELKHAGHPADNITRTLQILIDQRPALAVQVRKSGTTRQARKTYKVTEAGVRLLHRRVEGLRE